MKKKQLYFIFFNGQNDSILCTCSSVFSNWFGALTVGRWIMGRAEGGSKTQRRNRVRERERWEERETEGLFSLRLYALPLVVLAPVCVSACQCE